MNIQKMMKQAQQMQQKMQDLQKEMETKEVEGTSGGGMVVAKVNGKGIALGLTVDASLVDPEDKEVMEDLIVAALNDAKAKSEDMFQTEMGKLTGEMGLPADMKLPF